jgi:hypothetical protein
LQPVCRPQETHSWLLQSLPGTTMVEAAVVFPLVILSVAAVICILLFLFDETVTHARLHAAVRAASGKGTETVLVYRNVPGVIRTFADRRGMRPVQRAEETAAARGGGLLPRRLQKRIGSSAYEVNEKRFIRNVDFVRR